MSTPLDTELYAAVKKRADAIYSKPSAYKSGWMVRTYKSLGGRYGSKNTGSKTLKPKTGLTRWFKEKWKSVGEKKDYPVFRPTVRVSKDTPLLPSEIDSKNLKNQIKLKQKIKGKKNLPKFKAK